MLIIFGGLPGTGKTTLARQLAGHLRAAYLRIDTIELGLAQSSLGIDPAEDAGYQVAYGVAFDNLALGHTVIADSVNPIELSRSAWRAIADRAGRRAIEVQVMCSDPVEHRRRVETRTADLPGFTLPTWEDVCRWDYEPWDSANVIIDTAGRSVEASAAQLLAAITTP